MPYILYVIHHAVEKSELSLCSALSKRKQRRSHQGKSLVWQQNPGAWEGHTRTHTYTDVMKASPEGEGLACYIFWDLGQETAACVSMCVCVGGRLFHLLHPSSVFAQIRLWSWKWQQWSRSKKIPEKGEMKEGSDRERRWEKQGMCKNRNITMGGSVSDVPTESVTFTLRPHLWGLQCFSWAQPPPTEQQSGFKYFIIFSTNGKGFTVHFRQMEWLQHITHLISYNILFLTIDLLTVLLKLNISLITGLYNVTIV